MSETCDTFVEVILIHGAIRHNIQLKADDEEGSILTVAHLATEAEKITQVPVSSQKLIHKGKSLSSPSQSLSSLKIKNGSKIMLIGHKVDVEEDANMRAIRLLEKGVLQTEKKLSDVILEVDGIHKGFLAQDLQREALGKLGKRLASCAEEFTQHLEKLDSLMLADSFQDVRTQRKVLINKIQGFLEKLDTTQNCLNRIDEDSST